MPLPGVSLPLCCWCVPTPPPVGVFALLLTVLAQHWHLFIIITTPQRGKRGSMNSIQTLVHATPVDIPITIMCFEMLI